MNDQGMHARTCSESLIDGAAKGAVLACATAGKCFEVFAKERAFDWSRWMLLRLLLLVLAAHSATAQG